MQRILIRCGLVAGWIGCLGSLTGCGGDLGAGAGVVTRAVTLNVGWDSLTAGAGGATPTRSAIVTIGHANPDGSNLVFAIARPMSTTDPVAQTYSAPSAVVVGARELLVQFFTDSQPTGAVKLKIDTQLTVQSAGTTTAKVAQGATPAKLAVVSGQSVLVGATLSCLYQVTDVTGDLIPITPGSVACTLQSGAANLSVSGVNLTGLAPGAATVTAALGSLQSAPADISVTAP